MSEPKKLLEEYLGDGVYASFNGYCIVLDLRAQDSFTRIAMEPSVLVALDRFREIVKQSSNTTRDEDRTCLMTTDTSPKVETEQPPEKTLEHQSENTESS